jgi:hypothetical protein
MSYCNLFFILSLILPLHLLLLPLMAITSGVVPGRRGTRRMQPPRAVRIIGGGHVPTRSFSPTPTPPPPPPPRAFPAPPPGTDAALLMSICGKEYKGATLTPEMVGDPTKKDELLLFAQQQVLDHGLQPCVECGEYLNGAHRCDTCHLQIHTFCGKDLGEEGYNARRRCTTCQGAPPPPTPVKLPPAYSCLLTCCLRI